MVRMTDCKSSAAAMKYYNAERGFSYYGEGQEGPLRWWGKDTERLGLEGEVKREDFISLCNNENPETGEKLTVRQKDNRRVLMDITIDIGKEASLARELYRDEEIAKVARAALEETLKEIEANTETRVRRNGKQEDRVTGSSIFAIQEHRTARPVKGEPDALTHFHCLMFNATWDEKENRFKAVQLGNIKRDAPYYQAVFNSHFAKGLKGLGYAPTSTKYGVGLEGVPKSVIDKNSNRRNKILEDAAEKGITSGDGKHGVGYRNRESKSKEHTMEELRAIWGSRLTPEEKIAMFKVANKQVKRTTPVRDAEQALDYAISHEFERRSTLSEKRLKATALEYSIGDVRPGQVDKATRNRTDLILVKKAGEDRVTSRSTLNAEIEMLRFAKDGRGQYTPMNGGLELVEGLRGEQKANALHILNSRDRITGSRGGAGTGKTTLMRATVNAIIADIENDKTRKAFNKVYAFAPSSAASRGVLRNEGFENADTLASLLTNPEKQQAVRNQVIWVDEAGLVSTRDMNRLFNVAKEQNSRIILTGDYYQHGSVQAGDAFRLLESQGGVKYAELKQNRRQKNVTHKNAVVEMNKGTRAGVEKGWKMLDQLGSIVEAPDDLHKKAVDYYLKAQDDRKEALLICPTHKEGAVITSELREALRERGTLGKREKTFVNRIGMDWTDAQKGDSRNYEDGMIVQFFKPVPGVQQSVKGKRTKVGGFGKGECAAVLGQENGRVKLLRQDGSEAYLPEEYSSRFQVYSTGEIGIAKNERIRITQNGRVRSESGKMKQLNNGEVYTATGFTEEGDLKLNNGAILPKAFGNFRYGYVDTSQASQGKTVDRSAAVFGEGSLPAVNRQLALVAASRAREETLFLVSDKEAAEKAVLRGGERESALELIQGGKKDTWRDRLKERLERNRMVRYWRERRHKEAEKVRAYA